MNKVCICIPTLMRPAMLDGCLKNVSELETSDDVQLFIAVVDNDAQQSAKPVFDAARLSLPSRYEVEPVRGYASARNRCIDIANTEQCTHLLFVDDDMRPPPDYLKKLLATLIEKQADAARGTMIIVSTENGMRDKPRRSSVFLRQDMLPTGGLLISQKIFGEEHLRFDERFNEGGEDGDFTHRAHLRGARLYLAASAFYDELRPPERMHVIGRKDEWLRIYRTRRMHAAIRRSHGGWLRGLWFVLRQGIPLLLQIVGNALLLPLAPKKRGWKIILKSARIAGLLSGWLAGIGGVGLKQCVGRA